MVWNFACMGTNIFHKVQLISPNALFSGKCYLCRSQTGENKMGKPELVSLVKITTSKNIEIKLIYNSGLI